MKSLVVLLACIVAAHCLEIRDENLARIKLPGSCPEISYIQNLDLSLVEKKFYRHLSNDKGAQTRCDGRCFTNQHWAYQNGSLSGSKCCLREGDRKCIADTLLADKKTPGVFTLRRFPQLQFYVLSYGPEFLLSYGCFMKGDTEIQYGYGLTTEKVPSKEVSDYLQKKLKPFNILGLEILNNSDDCDF